VIGNKTEGALINMVRGWGVDYEKVKKDLYDDLRDKIFSFSSDKKRSTAVVHLSNGTVRLYCKGASEWLLKDCTHYKNQSGTKITYYILVIPLLYLC
jgi:magnesium-transporting ATPase (P-type)